MVARFVEERRACRDHGTRVASRAEQLRADLGDAVIGIAGDVSTLDDNRRAVAETVRAFGQKLDVFVGNAGIFDVYASFADLSDDKLSQAYDELFGVNVKGCIFGARAALRPELRKTNGSMVFTASVAGLTSGGGGVLYTASKHAVVGLVRELAVELAPDIRVNGVAPGGTMTDLRGLALTRRGRPLAVHRSRHRRPAAEAGNPLRTVLMPG